MVEYALDLENAVRYAGKWAYGRNPAFYDFDGLGGDCTNFISQCILAAGAPMNYTKDTGWYYVSLSKDRFYHSLLVVDMRAGQPCVAAHTADVYNRPLYSYMFDLARVLRIDRARK